MLLDSIPACLGTPLEEVVAQAGSHAAEKAPDWYCNSALGAAHTVAVGAEALQTAEGATALDIHMLASELAIARVRSDSTSCMALVAGSAFRDAALTLG